MSFQVWRGNWQHYCQLGKFTWAFGVQRFCVGSVIYCSHDWPVASTPPEDLGWYGPHVLQESQLPGMQLSKSLLINSCPVPKSPRQIETLLSGRMFQGPRELPRSLTSVLILYYARAVLCLLWESSFATSGLPWFTLIHSVILGSKFNSCLALFLVSELIDFWGLWGLGVLEPFLPNNAQGTEGRGILVLGRETQVCSHDMAELGVGSSGLLPECICEQKTKPASGGWKRSLFLMQRASAISGETRNFSII